MSIFKQKHKEFGNKKIEKIISENNIEYKIGNRKYTIEEMKREYFEKKIIHKYRVELPGTKSYKFSEVTNLLYKVNKDKLNEEYFIKTFRSNQEKSEKEFEERVKEYDFSTYSFGYKYILKEGRKEKEKYYLKRSYYNDEERNKLFKRLELKEDINTLLRKILFFERGINNRIKLDYELCTVNHFKGIKSEIEKLCSYSRDDLLLVDSRINIEVILFKLGDKKRNQFNKFLRFLANHIEQNTLGSKMLYEYLKSEEFSMQVYNFFIFSDKEYKEEDLDNKYASKSIEKKLNNIFYNNSIENRIKSKEKITKDKLDIKFKLEKLKASIKEEATRSIDNRNSNYEELDFKILSIEDFNKIKTKEKDKKKYFTFIDTKYKECYGKYLEQIEEMIRSILNKYDTNELEEVDNLRQMVKEHYKHKFGNFPTKAELYAYLDPDYELSQEEVLWVLKNIHQIVKSRANKVERSKGTGNVLKFSEVFGKESLEKKIIKKIISKIKYKNKLLEINNNQNKGYIKNDDDLETLSNKKQIVKIEETFRRKVSQNISTAIYYINKQYNKSEYLKNESYVFSNDSETYSKNKFYDIFSFGVGTINIDENKGQKQKDKTINYFKAIDSSDIKQFKGENKINSLCINVLRNYTYHATEMKEIDSDTLKCYKKQFNDNISLKVKEMINEYNSHQNWKLLSNSVKHFYTKEEVQSIIDKLDFSSNKNVQLPRFSKLLNITFKEEEETGKNYYVSVLKKVFSKYEKGSKEYNAKKYLLELIYNYWFVNLKSYSNYKIPDNYKQTYLKELEDLINYSNLSKTMEIFQKYAEGNNEKVKEYQKIYERFVLIIFEKWLEKQADVFGLINKEFKEEEFVDYDVKISVDFKAEVYKNLYTYLKYYITVLDLMDINEVSKLKQNINRYRYSLTSFFENKSEDSTKLFNDYIKLMTNEDIQLGEYLKQLELVETYIGFYIPLMYHNLVSLSIIDDTGKKGIILGENSEIEELYKSLYNIEDISTLNYLQYIENEFEEKETNILYQDMKSEGMDKKYFIPNSFLIEYNNKGLLETYKEVLNKNIDFSKVLSEFSKYQTSNKEKRIEYYQEQYREEYDKVKEGKENTKEKLEELNNKIKYYDYLKICMNLKLLENKIKFDYDISCRIISEVRKFDNLSEKSEIRNNIDHFDYLSMGHDISNLYENIGKYYIWLDNNNYLKERNALKEIFSTHLSSNRIDFTDIKFTDGGIRIMGCKPRNNSFLEDKGIPDISLICREEMEFLLQGIEI